MTYNHTSLSAELKPCPFCGGVAAVRTYQDESLWSHDIVTKTQVGCDNCDYSFATEPGYEVEALDLWNARPAIQEQEPVGWLQDTQIRKVSGLCGDHTKHSVELVFKTGEKSDEAFLALNDMQANRSPAPDLVRELVSALDAAREWLSGWASAEPYINKIDTALAKAMERGHG